ncbi:MAG: hypothetical protein ACRDUS_06485, partial [Mycobacterium sp.]
AYGNSASVHISGAIHKASAGRHRIVRGVGGERHASGMDPRIRSRSLSVHQGISDSTLARCRRTQGWQTLRRGYFIDAEVAAALGDADRHRMQVEVAAPVFGDNTVFSHASAAVLHGLALWRVPLDRVHVTRNRSHGGRRSRTSVGHAARLDASQICSVEGLSATTVARTVCDLARLHGFATGVVAADDALHRGLLSHAELSDAVARAQGSRGAGAARATNRFADGRSESSGESRSRILFSAAGIAPIELQRRIVDTAGRVIARADFYFDGNVVGEFDGMAKYGRLLRAGDTAGDAIAREKLREDRIRDTNRVVVRWTWRDLSTPELLVRRVRDAIARGRAAGAPATP